MAAQVLRFVNSSFFGFSREVANLRLAVTLVGVRTIKNFVMWSAVFSLLPNPAVRSVLTCNYCGRIPSVGPFLPGSLPSGSMP